MRGLVKLERSIYLIAVMHLNYDASMLSLKKFSKIEYF